MTQGRGEYDVLIAGLGPVGAVLAALCGQAGLSVRAVERDTEVYKLPRAIAMDFEVLRQLGLIGIADDILSTAVTTTGYEFINRDRDILTSRYHKSLTSSTGYPPIVMFHQPSMEQAVRQKLESLENVEISLGCELQSFSQSLDDVRAVLRTGDQEETVTAKYLVACDGGRSPVRRALGIDVYDLGFDEPWMVVDVRLKPELDKVSEFGTQLCDPARPTTSAPSGKGRHRWEFMIKPEDDREKIVEEASIRDWISDWVDPDLVDIERRAIYEFHGVIAERWRDRRVLLIGDAAHQMPPFLGQGLCSGVRDACNLAWKLIAVVQERASAELLDSVQAERESHVATITKNAIELGRIVCIADEREAAERDRQMIAAREAGVAPSFPSMPVVVAGVLASPGAGAVMPEPMVSASGEAVRLDDVAGFVPVLLVKDFAALSESDQQLAAALGFSAANGTLFAIGEGGGADPRAIDANGELSDLMAGAAAILAKPDRTVFGTGDASELLSHWRAYLQGASMPGLTATA